jgi:hypothetical protein
MMSRPERRGVPTGERARLIPGRDFENIFFQTSSSFGIFQIDGITILPPCLQSASMYSTIQSYHQEDNLVLYILRTRS